jgi:hypothetical protein
MVKKAPIGIRLEDEERAALEKAAASEVASLSGLGRKVIVGWLRREGWLKAAKKAPSP